VQVAGTSGKVQQTADEDAEGISSDAHGAAITEALGIERRNEVHLHASHLPYIMFQQSFPACAVNANCCHHERKHPCVLVVSFDKLHMLPLWEAVSSIVSGLGDFV